MLNGFPKAMKCVVGIFAAVLIAEGAFVLVAGVQQKATAAEAPRVAALKLNGPRGRS